MNVRSGRIHYRFDGPADAPVVVLANSLGTNLAMWDPQVPALARQFRVLRYDTRGHGLSAVSPGPYTIAGLGCDVVDLLDGLGIAQAHFCGLSLGGMTGIWLGAHAAGHLKRLVLCNTAARIATAQIWNTRIATARAGDMSSIATGSLQRWFTDKFAASAPAVLESTRRMLLETPAEGYAACCEAIRDANFVGDLARITVPTMVIAGSHDPSTPPADGRFLSDNIPAARYYVELNAAHLSNIEAAAPFTNSLLQFLNQPEVKG